MSFIDRFRYFRSVGRFSVPIRPVDYSEIMSSFDCYQNQLLSRVQREIPGSKHNKLILTCSIIYNTFFINCTSRCPSEFTIYLFKYLQNVISIARIKDWFVGVIYDIIKIHSNQSKSKRFCKHFYYLI